MSFTVRADEPEMGYEARDERPRQVSIEVQLHAERIHQLGMAVDQLESRLAPITQRSPGVPDSAAEQLKRAVEEVNPSGPLTQELARQNRELGALLERIAQLAATVEI